MDFIERGFWNLCVPVICKAGEEQFRLPNGQIADGASVEKYLEEQVAVRNFYVWSRDSYCLSWYFRFNVLEELMVRRIPLNLDNFFSFK